MHSLTPMRKLKDMSLRRVCGHGAAPLRPPFRRKRRDCSSCKSRSVSIGGNGPRGLDRWSLFKPRHVPDDRLAAMPHAFKGFLKLIQRCQLRMVARLKPRRAILIVSPPRADTSGDVAIADWRGQKIRPSSASPARSRSIQFLRCCVLACAHPRTDAHGCECQPSRSGNQGSKNGTIDPHQEPG